MAKRSRKKVPVRLLVALGFVIFIVLAVGVYLLTSKRLPQPPAAQPRVTITSTTQVNTVTIYVPEKSGSGVYLAAQDRTIEGKDGILDLSVKALLADRGKLEGGGSIIPEGTRLLGPIKVEDSTAVVDLSSEFVDKFEGGSDKEAFTLNAIAMTICKADPKIKSVRILVGGKPVDSLGGHYDLSVPITPDSNLAKPD